ncbi:MAG: 30S ribosomal protein S7, partial [Verrucomicrobia bacterium]|nr:30S ribosomal protein S7 [Verrucomicrobiota bacterium]
MARRRRADKRDVIADPRYNSELVAHYVNHLMRCGKKSTAERIIYDALDQIKEQTKQDPIEVLERATDNAKPRLEVKSRRVGGATYQVPIEVAGGRQRSLALRWLIQFAKSRKGMPMKKALAVELLDAYNGQGSCIKKRDDTHKMA